MVYYLGDNLCESDRNQLFGFDKRRLKMLYYDRIDQVKELMLLKVIIVKNIQFVIIGILIISSNFKALFVIVVII